MLRKLLLSLFAISILCCENEKYEEFPPNGSEDPIIGDFADNFGNEISADFYGEITDINNSPISDVNIVIGNQTVSTDANGIFILENAQVFENFAYIKANKLGYLSGSRTVIPSVGLNKVKIVLLEEIVIETVSSGEPSMVALPNGASVSFDGNFISGDNTAYEGTVNVVMHFLDPTDDTIDQQMPGMLYGEDLLGQENVLKSFGMLAVELKSENGEPLNLAEGSVSELTMPLDMSLISSAPNSIPLWYFDDAKGYWIEEGMATLQGNSYVGTVSHFSFWNCDIPVESVNLCINLLDNNNEPLSNIAISLTSESVGTTGGFTNDLGAVCGLIPANEVLVLQSAADFDCQSVDTQTIGPFNADTTIDVIIANPESFLINETITGTVTSCDDEPIQNGYVLVNYNDDSYIEFISNGAFELEVNRCPQGGDTFSINAYDLDNFLETGQLNDQSFSTPITDLGNLTTCDEVEFYITYQIDDEDPVTIPGEVIVAAAENNTYVYVAQQNYNQGSFQLFIYEDSVDLLYIQENGVVRYEDCIDLDDDGICDNLDNMNYNLLNWGLTIGDIVTLEFDGTIADVNGETRTLTGSLNVEIIYD